MSNETADAATSSLKSIAKDTEATKRLLVLLLIKLGANTDEIGLALGVTGRSVRNLFPTGQIKKYKIDQSA